MIDPRCDTSTPEPREHRALKQYAKRTRMGCLWDRRRERVLRLSNIYCECDYYTAFHALKETRVNRPRKVIFWLAQQRKVGGPSVLSLLTSPAGQREA